MIDEIKRNLEYYEETVDSVNDRLYFKAAYLSE